MTNTRALSHDPEPGAAPPEEGVAVDTSPAASVGTAQAPSQSSEPRDVDPGASSALIEEAESHDPYPPKLRSPKRKRRPAAKKAWWNKRRRGRRRGSRRVEILAGMLIISIAVWIVFTVLSTHPEPPRALTLTDLPSSVAIHRVFARPPSLYVDVGAGSWDRLTPGERVDLVERVGATARAAGYTGALFRTAGGAGVAQWMKAGGARVFDRTAPDS